ncbi:MAG: hypothetical protein M3308_04790 [Actinomycetota bacterium]|nr:hypothetical protein [Actinomycetota bacterium]
MGALLPSLLLDTQRAVRVLAGAERRAASAVLAGIYHLAQKFLAYQPVPELVFLSADRSTTTAEEADEQAWAQPVDAVYDYSFLSDLPECLHPGAGGCGRPALRAAPW